jgi:hypothetical protein
MRASFLALAAACCLAAWSAAAGAQENSLLVGVWAGEDPDSGEQGQITFTANTLQFGEGEPEIPYTAEGSGGTYLIYIGPPGNPPATFTFRDADHASLAVPGGPTIPLARVAVSAEAAAVGAPGGQEGHGAGEGATLMDELTAALVPHGVDTRFEPMKQSLETLLSAGWKLDQAAGASGGFTLLLTKGSSNALCILVPKDFGQADTALSDCRLLN